MGRADKTIKVVKEGGMSEFAFLLAWVGAVIYFVDKASGFWEVIVAVLKASVWPAFVMYHVLQLLSA